VLSWIEARVRVSDRQSLSHRLQRRSDKREELCKAITAPCSVNTEIGGQNGQYRCGHRGGNGDVRS
jgi:hypothetical protein